MQDHYHFKKSDLEFNDNLPILMTEKDAVKCVKIAKENTWYVPLSIIPNERLDERTYKITRGNSLMDMQLLDILVCPVTKGPLKYDKDHQELISTSARLAYPIRDGIPVMLEDEARTISDDEYEKYKAM